VLLGRAIRGLLFGVQPTDPLTIAGVGAVLLVVSVLACLIPARRAAGADASSRCDSSGFTHSLRGHLFEANRASRRLARNVARYLRRRRRSGKLHA
jgi:hypothetical protein